VAADAASTVADVHRAEWGRIVAALIAMTGDVDLAEDAAQEAFAVALEEWTARGVPDHPRAWLIRDAGIPYQVPAAAEMPERLDAVLTVIYLVFNEGYAATRGTPLVRADLCAEAIRLGRLVVATLGPDDASEASALVALMLLHDARRDTRQDHAGDLILLEDQDRGRWNHAQIREALPMVEDALRRGTGPFAVQAAIAALHVQATAAASTDWRQIASLYDVLLRLHPSPVVRLNAAVAAAMAEGPTAGLGRLDALAETGELENYHLYHAARAELERRAQRPLEAAVSYERALALVSNEVERRHLTRRLADLRT
jgi:RNA polymerase sigma-70 factor (ECF subfamily)